RILATVTGPEGFIDENGDNICDDDDIFSSAFDLGETYPSRAYDIGHAAGDDFLGSDGNRSRDQGDTSRHGLDCQKATFRSADIRYVNLAAVTTLFVSQGSNPTICSAGDFADSTLTFDIGSLSVRSGLFLSDGNLMAPNPLHICSTGNPLPSGTEISFSATGGTLEGQTSWVVEDIVSLPTGPYGIRFKAGTTASTGTLTLKVSVPGEQDREFHWNISVE